MLSVFAAPFQVGFCVALFITELMSCYSMLHSYMLPLYWVYFLLSTNVPVYVEVQKANLWWCFLCWALRTNLAFGSYGDNGWKSCVWVSWWTIVLFKQFAIFRATGVSLSQQTFHLLYCTFAFFLLRWKVLVTSALFLLPDPPWLGRVAWAREVYPSSLKRKMMRKWAKLKVCG